MEQEEENGEFDPSADSIPGMEQEEGCVVDNENEEEEEDEDDFLELGSAHEDEEDDEEEDEEEEEDDDGEVDDEVVVSESNEAEEDSSRLAEHKNVGSEQGGSTGLKRKAPYTDQAECSSHHEDEELMGGALEALPELHSPAHHKYVLDSHADQNAEDEEAVMDAISKRTRARYSLADMTLDQLETFLQESDEDDYFHNVDDEEEYRKFLAAVAQPEVAEAVQEDEEDDMDFEIEIQEALESETEQNRDEQKSGRRPETRVQRRERLQNKERLLGFAKTPLRPLVPYHVVPPDMSHGDRGNYLPETSFRQPVQPYGMGFTSHQIGQLHCLIHEHVQLLVQVFSLCIMEPSRQQVAIDTHRMLMELVNKRDSSTFNSVAFPEFCFARPFIHPSTEAYNQFEPEDWTPSVPRPIYSILSVAPLDLVKDYLDNVSVVVRDYKQRHVQPGFNSRSDREPLFPLRETINLNKGTQQMAPQVKKTMAAQLVENTKKQVIALVPKGIVTAAARFIPFFNPAMFPHKPPPAATANRLLFTDAEDELLAMGLMIFNTDWKAIQQRFLPTKSTHQIFVRQKNRSSSRAPENSIKAVRRMKSSSLTVEEKESIHEALKCFKYDWFKVWQHAVPHRDPALLPRQWRTAIGTQKSYKSDEIAKGKRRLHEASRRRMKAMQKDADTQEQEWGGTDPGGEVTNSEDDVGDCDEAAHIHEAFLWRADANLAVRPLQSGHLQLPLGKSVHPLLTEAGTAAGTLDGAGHSPRKRSRTVKLAPGLPLVNLPPHVRVISQSFPRSDTTRPSNACGGAKVQPNQGKFHPLLLQPSCLATSSTGARSSSSYVQQHPPAFHPFFGVPRSQDRSFQPLLHHTPQKTTPGQASSGSKKRDKHAASAEQQVDVSGFALARSQHCVGNVSTEQEKLAVSAARADADVEVQFECEEIDDSDTEGVGKDIEFEEEEIDESDSEMERPARTEAPTAAESDSKENKDEEKEIDATAIEAAHVLTEILRN